MTAPISTDAAPAAIGPYSQAIDADGLVFVSGQLPIDPATGTMPDDVAAQARQSLANMTAILAAAGLTPSDVVKSTVFLTDMADFDVVNGAYAEVFVAPHPARSCVQVARLPKDARVEVEVVARRG